MASGLGSADLFRMLGSFALVLALMAALLWALRKLQTRMITPPIPQAGQVVKAPASSAAPRTRIAQQAAPQAVTEPTPEPTPASHAEVAPAPTPPAEPTLPPEAPPVLPAPTEAAPASPAEPVASAKPTEAAPALPIPAGDALPGRRAPRPDH